MKKADVDRRTIQQGLKNLKSSNAITFGFPQDSKDES